VATAELASYGLTMDYSSPAHKYHDTHNNVYTLHNGFFAFSPAPASALASSLLLARTLGNAAFFPRTRAAQTRNDDGMERNEWVMCTAVNVNYALLCDVSLLLGFTCQSFYSGDYYFLPFPLLSRIPVLSTHAYFMHCACALTRSTVP